MGKLQWHRSLVLICVIFMGGCDQIIDFPFYNGFVAKNVCSGVFVSGIQEDIMRDEYAGPNVYPLPLFWQVNVDYNNKAVTASDIIFQSSAEQQAWVNLFLKTHEEAPDSGLVGLTLSAEDND